MPKAQAKQVQIDATITEADRAILTDEAVNFLTALSHQFEERRQQLLERRRVRQQQIDGGVLPEFLKETAEIRNSDWVAASIPADLQDRRVEITGPVDRKMIINALNSGASVFMADLEDSEFADLAQQPGWPDQLAPTPSTARSAMSAPRGKRYELGAKTAVLMVRPRGWHLNEKHFLVDGSPISASLFDFRTVLLSQRQDIAREGERPLFLSAQNGEPSGSPAVERRVSFRAGLGGCAAGKHSRHRADRNHPGCV